MLHDRRHEARFWDADLTLCILRELAAEDDWILLQELLSCLVLTGCVLQLLTKYQLILGLLFLREQFLDKGLRV